MSEVKAEEVVKAAEEAYAEGRKDGYDSGYAEASNEAYDEGYADGLSDRDHDEVLRRAVGSAGLDPHRDFIGRWDAAERRWFFHQETDDQ